MPPVWWACSPGRGDFLLGIPRLKFLQCRAVGATPRGCPAGGPTQPRGTTGRYRRRQAGEKESGPVSRLLSRAVIPLGRVLPPASSAPPEDSAGRVIVLCLSLLHAGFAEHAESPPRLGVSYTSVSPLQGDRPLAVCSLWHFPSGHPAWALPSALPYGGRTFLSRERARPRPPGPLSGHYCSTDSRRCQGNAGTGWEPVLLGSALALGKL